MKVIDEWTDEKNGMKYRIIKDGKNSLLFVHDGDGKTRKKTGFAYCGDQYPLINRIVELKKETK